MKPTIGRIVIYRSKVGAYVIPAIITATIDTLAPEGLARWHDTDGREGVPPLDSNRHVHLTVFTPGYPAQHRLESGAAWGGTYQEWNVPEFVVGSVEGGTTGGFVEGDVVPPLPVPAKQPPGTWHWPVRIT